MTSEPNNPLVTGGEFTARDMYYQNFDSVQSGVEGSGPLGGAVNAFSNAAQEDWFGFAAEVAGVGLDTLGIVMNPLEGFTRVGIGWLIEHVGFLKEGLDLLAGDPDAVSATAQNWTNIAASLRESASRFERSRAGICGGGAALIEYQNTAHSYSLAVATAASHADKASSAVHAAGTIVAITRAMVRDKIAEWVADRIIKWFTASALTPLSFGATQGMFITDSVWSGARLSRSIADDLTKVATKLDETAAAAARSGDAFSRATRALDDIANKQARATKASARRAAAGKNIDNPHAGGSRAQRQRAHDDLVKQERNAHRQAERVADSPAARAIAESKAVAAGKEAGVQAGGQDDRQNKARENYERWRAEGSLDEP